jgi:micrococcal nuclease
MRNRWAVPLLLATVVLLGLAAVGYAQRIEVSLVSLTSPARRGTDATIVVQTAPRAHCLIGVQYKSGPSHAAGLVPKDADGKGRVAWTWRVGTSTTPGTWPVTVVCAAGEQQGTLTLSLVVK